MKSIIIYKGKYGATQQYAEWLSTELNLPVVPADAINGKGLRHYDCLILGTSVYIGKLQIKKWLRKNLPFIKGKKIFFFQVAGAPPSDTEKRQAYNLSCIPPVLIRQCSWYYLPGKMSIKKLSWMDRFMLKMGARLSKDPAEKKQMLAEYNEVKRDYLIPLIRDARNYIRPGTKPLETMAAVH